jgi:hypothetical protein
MRKGREVEAYSRFGVDDAVEGGLVHMSFVV